MFTLPFLTAGWAVDLGKWLLSKLTLRNIGVLIALIAIAYGQYRFYGWAQARQYEEDKVVIDRVAGERDKIQAKYTAYRTAFKAWVFRSETARLKMEKANAENVAKIEHELAAAKVQAAKTRGRTHEVPKYVPPSADYVLPAGFVRLYNLSLEGEPGYTAPADLVSEGVSFDVGAPSGLTLSAFSVISTENLSECVYRGEVIRKWQDWYVREEASFTQTQKDAAAAIPRVEPDASDEPQGSK